MSGQLRADEGGVPWCIQPELTEGCTRLCNFCGLNAIRETVGFFKFMSEHTATLIAEQVAELCPTARIEFAMRGEPMANPKAIAIFHIFRGRLPKAQMMVTTNGDPFRHRMQEVAENCFRAGLNFILMDTYYPEPGRTNLINEARSLKDITVVDYFEDWMPRGRSPYHNHGSKIQNTIVLMDDLAARDGEHGSRLVKTHAGSNPSKEAPTEPLTRNCGRPFREMTIAYDGAVTLCCDDWRKQYIVENVHRTHLRDIWKHPRFEAARARLYYKDRGFGPCVQCDAPSAPRSGLLPYYEYPTSEDIRITDAITEANAHIIPLWKKEKK